MEKPIGEKPWPAIVFLHGHQEGVRPGGKVFAEWGVLEGLARRGYLAVAVSQPGYGNSTGSADFCGVFTQHAVSGVISKLRDDGLIAPNGLLIEGVSRGAVVAGLLAAHDSAISGVVLISGLYDLCKVPESPKGRHVKADLVKSMVEETGGTIEALRARSVLFFAKEIKAAVLILNGEKDDRTDPGQARHLAEEITRFGGRARAIIYPSYGHQIPSEVRNREIDPFIEEILKKVQKLN